RRGRRLFGCEQPRGGLVMSNSPREGSSRYSRRSFLGRVGAGAAVMGAGGLLQAEGAAAKHGRSRSQHVYSTAARHWGRICTALPPFAPANAQIEAPLRDMGKPGGVLDARDAPDQGPVLLITDPSLSVNNPNNPTHTAGTTFVGQFVDHDITFDVGSTLGRPTAPESAGNRRAPGLRLRSGYGGGAGASPRLFASCRRARRRSESGGGCACAPRSMAA